MAMRMAVMALRNAAEARRDRREEKAPEFNTEGTEVAQRAPRRALGCAPTIARFSGFAAVISLLQRRGRVVGEFVLAGVGALYFELVEEERRADDRCGDASGAIADQRIVADCD